MDAPRQQVPGLESEARSRVVAFFDLDRTLLDINSATLWAQHELRHRNISRSQFARALLWNGLYHLSLIDIEEAFRRAVAHYRGRLFDDLEDETRQWFLADVATHLRPGARRAIDDHRRRGHRLVLLTSASCFEARVAADTWKLDGWLANHFPTDAEGRLTGDFRRPLCYGAGKTVHAQAWAEEHGASLNDAYFYTDSLSDLPMLEAVGHPKIVSPDPRLRRVAKARSWPILDW